MESHRFSGTPGNILGHCRFRPRRIPSTPTRQPLYKAVLSWRDGCVASVGLADHRTRGGTESQLACWPVSPPSCRVKVMSFACQVRELACRPSLAAMKPGSCRLRNLHQFWVSELASGKNIFFQTFLRMQIREPCLHE